MATNTSTPGVEPDTSIFGRLFTPGTEYFYLLFRLIFAFLVSLHGAQKAFQMWGFPPPGTEGALRASCTWPAGLNSSRRCSLDSAY